MKPTYCWTYLRDVRRAIHDESSDTYKLALYSSMDGLDPATLEFYTPTNEVTGVGYAAGGLDLTLVLGAELQPDGYVITQFADAMWPGAVFTARGGLIYNSSKSDRAAVVLDFLADYAATGGMTFGVYFPTPTSDGAIMRSRNAQ